ncbi:MAG: serine/threonine protein kinase [Acidobacteriaceae bacterium]|jgi:serine/threonine protein kinase|nr:serine/threonine protein kinase [Acidobacteriaceae bacterium]
MIGETFSHYRITGRLGVGGMGIVYAAVDERLARPVALKFLAEELAASPDATRRLRREAQILAHLNHPGICTIYEISEVEGRLCLVMERLDGVNLKSHIAKKTLDTNEVIEIAMQVADALASAHAKDIVHRDIKPGNIFVGSSGQVKVLDFGMAKSFNPELVALRSDGSTIPGRPIGTVNYMAPERILQSPLDGRSDLFSLGVVMYEMATGRLPFAGSSPSDTVTNILDKQPDAITALSPQHPEALDEIVQRLLAKMAEDRYQSARDLVAALHDLGERRRGWRSRLFGRLFTSG